MTLWAIHRLAGNGQPGRCISNNTVDAADRRWQHWWMDTLDERALRIFLAVVRLQSIRKAAAALGMAPSIVSRQIAALEHDAGLLLFERSSRGVTPTEAGELLREHAQRVVEEQHVLAEQLDLLRNVHQATVRLWCGEGFLADLLENALHPFSAVYPQIRYAVHLGGTASVTQAIVDGEADIGVLYNPPTDVRLRSLAMQRQPLCAVLPLDHPLSGRRELRLADCLGVPMALLDPDHGVTQLVWRVAANEGAAVAPLVQTNSIDLLRRFVAAKMGLTFLPRFAVFSGLEAGDFAAIPMSDPMLAEATAHVLVRSRRRLPQSVERLAGYIAQHMVAFRS